MAQDEAYRFAEQKIEKARRSGSKELDLIGSVADSSKLTELPESLGQLTQLQALDLSNNHLTQLPDWLNQLTGLQVLRLSYNGLMTIPE